MSDINPIEGVLRVSRVETRQIDLVDESGKTRATLDCSSAENRGYVVMHLYGDSKSPRLSLQVTDKEGASISLWNQTSPCVTLGVLTSGNGISIKDGDGKPMIDVGVRAGQASPDITVRDSNGTPIFTLP